MNFHDSLRAITRRAFRIEYRSPAICPVMLVSSGSGSGTSCPAIIDMQTVTQAAGPVLTLQFFSDLEFLLTWTAISNAYGYQVYRSTSPDGPFELLIGGLLDTLYVDEPPTLDIFYYKVTAIEPNWGETLPSNVVSGQIGENARITNDGELRFTIDDEVRFI